MTDQTATLEPMKTEIAEYSPTAAALAELRQRYAGVVFPVTTTKGMDEAKAARKELRDLRTGLEKMRKDIKEPALRRCQLIDTEAKTITAQLVELEDPIDAQIKAEEKRKEAEKAERERIERERVEAIRARINGIAGLPAASAHDSAADIQATLDDLEGLLLTEDLFAEFKDEAQATRQTALDALAVLRDAAQAREDEAARVKEEAARLERERAALEEARKAEEAEREKERLALEEERAAIARERAELEALRQASAPAPEAITPAPDAVLHQEEVEPYVAIPYDVVGIDPGADDSTVMHPVGDAVMGGEVMEAVAHMVNEAPHPVEEPSAEAVARDLATYTALQFRALARKVAAFGFLPLAEDFHSYADSLDAGTHDALIMGGDWYESAQADKEMALASHACVAVVLGDEAMGEATLRREGVA